MQQWVLVAVLLASIAVGYYTLAAVGGPEALLQVLVIPLLHTAFHSKQATPLLLPKQDIQDLTNEGGFLAAALFAAAYVLATILLIPASVLTLAAGYIFGRAHAVTLTRMLNRLPLAIAGLNDCSMFVMVQLPLCDIQCMPITNAEASEVGTSAA